MPGRLTPPMPDRLSPQWWIERDVLAFRFRCFRFRHDKFHLVTFAHLAFGLGYQSTID